MKHTTKTVADQMEKQHSNVKSVVEKLHRERHVLFLEKLKVTKYGRTDSKTPPLVLCVERETSFISQMLFRS